jgi:hypothetical protein
MRQRLFLLECYMIWSLDWMVKKGNTPPMQYSDMRTSYMRYCVVKTCQVTALNCRCYVRSACQVWLSSFTSLLLFLCLFSYVELGDADCRVATMVPS